MNKQRIASLVILPIVLLGLTGQAYAQDVKPPTKVVESEEAPSFGPVDYDNIDFSRDAPFFEGDYIVPKDKLITAKLGGEYVDEEGYLRMGVPIPINIAFNEKDEKGEFTFKGMRPPTQEEMDANAKLPVENWNNGKADLLGKERPLPQQTWHWYEGIWPIRQSYNTGILAVNSSVTFSMASYMSELESGYKVIHSMFPGNGCLETLMMHARVNTTQYHQHQYDNHCYAKAGLYPQLPSGYGPFGFETRNAAWISDYERTLTVGSSYYEYIFANNRMDFRHGDTDTCSAAYMYKYSTGQWVKKAEACGWGQVEIAPNEDYPYGWSFQEAWGLQTATGTYCAAHGQQRSDSINYWLIDSPTTGHWEHLINDGYMAMDYNNMYPSPCNSWPWARNTWGGATGFITW